MSKFTQQVSGQDQGGGHLPPGTVRTGYVGVITPTSAMKFISESGAPGLRCPAKYRASRPLTKHLSHSATLRPYGWGARSGSPLEMARVGISPGRKELQCLLRRCPRDPSQGTAAIVKVSTRAP